MDRNGNEGADRPVILIGFMGAGKSTVGRWLSRRLSWRFLDTDAMIEARAGMTVSRIFETRGEDAFRETESAVIGELARLRGPAIVSTGGGVPLREDNRRVLRNIGYVVYLRVRPETVCRRLARDRSRPLLQGCDRNEKVTALLSARDPVYTETAHLTVDTDRKRPEQIGEEILSGIPGLSRQTEN